MLSSYRSLPKQALLGVVFVGVVLSSNWKSGLLAQKFEANYDEAKVPQYELPVLIDAKTAAAKDFASAWELRRTELMDIFAKQMYGTSPTSAYELKFEKIESANCCSGLGLRQQWRVWISTQHGQLPIDLLVFTPSNANGPVPCFLGLNFGGNHTITTDKEIPLTTSWIRENKVNGVSNNNQASESGRGAATSRWPIEQILAEGMGVATAYYGDIDPDFDDEFTNGVHALFPEHRPSAEHPDRWGSIAAWSWGLSRLLDCMSMQIKEVDAARVAVIGHSRLGKTALWAGATDRRFALVISNDSGCGGAALSRRAIGETVGRINTSFPHWFCPNFKQYNLNENSLPIDQHQLLAAVAPRPIYVASASQDLWADPHGEFLSLSLAAEVYQRFPTAKSGSSDAPVMRLGYHLRDGKHDINAWDWSHYLRFMKQL